MKDAFTKPKPHSSHNMIAPYTNKNKSKYAFTKCVAIENYTQIISMLH